MLIFIISWLLSGILGVQIAYYSTLKSWYFNHGESYWDFDKRNGDSAIRFLLIFSPILVIGGCISLFTITITTYLNEKHNFCLYFKVSNK